MKVTIDHTNNMPDFIMEETKRIALERSLEITNFAYSDLYKKLQDFIMNTTPNIQNYELRELVNHHKETVSDELNIRFDIHNNWIIYWEGKE